MKERYDFSEGTQGKYAQAKEWIVLLNAWRAAAALLMQHIRTCAICHAAEANGGVSYCEMNDRMWEEMMSYEYKVKAVLPEMRDAGVDVDSVIKDFK
jgi:hypothetical protein